jgi:DNA-binding MarR family transcriptional regulator
MKPDPLLPYDTTIDVRDLCLCLHVQRAARAVARHYDELLRPVGLTNGQFSILMSLNRPQPPQLGSVATLLGLDRTTLTANLKPLERRGLLKITIDPDDKRGRRISLTAKGRGALIDAMPIWREAQAQIAHRMKHTKVAEFRAALMALS